MILSKEITVTGKIGSIYGTVSDLLFSFREDLHLPFRIFAFV
jgi:hypothetical protein